MDQPILLSNLQLVCQDLMEHEDQQLEAVSDQSDYQPWTLGTHEVPVSTTNTMMSSACGQPESRTMLPFFKVVPIKKAPPLLFQFLRL